MDQINILVTDDEREIADLLEIYLVSDGYRVWKAYSAKEGLQILRTLGKNMVWLLKSIQAGKDNGVVQPSVEEKIYTNFIR